MVVIETKDALITEGMIAMTLGRDQPGGVKAREYLQKPDKSETKNKTEYNNIKSQQEKKQSMFGAKHESDCDELMHSSRQINEAYALHKPPRSPPKCGGALAVSV